MLEEVLGGVKLDPAIVGAKTVPKAPGMKYKHYAPKAPMTLLEGRGPRRWPPRSAARSAILQEQGRNGRHPRQP